MRRVRLANDYLRIMAFLHGGNPQGVVYVMCDANWLAKSLSQLLVSETGHVLLNDVDALPRVDRAAGLLVKCGHRRLHRHAFVAPEQEWPYPDRPFKCVR